MTLSRVFPGSLRRSAALLAHIAVFAAVGFVSIAASAAEVDTNVVITERAKQHFRSGVALLQDPDGARYDEAYLEFRAAYAESPSWKILGNLGISAMKLERDGEAIEAFEIYLRDGGAELEETERAQFQRDLDLLRANVTWVTISSKPVGATVLDVRTPVAGRPVENRYDALNAPLRIGVHAGKHTIRVELSGYEPSIWTFEARGGELEHVFELTAGKADPPNGGTGASGSGVFERPTPVGVYVGLGATGVLAAAATVTGILALDKKSLFDRENGSDEAAATRARNDGQTLNLVTDVFIGSAVVAAGVTTYLYLSRPSVEVSPEGTARAWRVLPVAGASGGGFVVSGIF